MENLIGGYFLFKDIIDYLDIWCMFMRELRKKDGEKESDR
jgi:hypothetical protein